MTIGQKLESGAYKNPLPWPHGKTAMQDIARQAYRAKDHEIYDEFKRDLLAYLASEGVPAQYHEKVFAHAWEEGHSGGFSEVYAYATGLVEIFT